MLSSETAIRHPVSLLLIITTIFPQTVSRELEMRFIAKENLRHSYYRTKKGEGIESWRVVWRLGVYGGFYAPI